jgi:lysophospholipase L1-like esterase
VNSAKPFARLSHTAAAATLLAAAVLALSAAVATAGGAKRARTSSEPWVRAWGAAVMAPEEFDYYPDLGRTFRDVTLRQVVVVTLSGRSLRVLISNEYGTQSLLLTQAHVARVATGAQIDGASDRPMLFEGKHSISVPAGAAVFSDPIDLSISAGTPLAVSLYLPHSTEGSPSTVHEEGWRTGYVSKTGDFTGSVVFPVAAQLRSYFYLAAVDVRAGGVAGAIVALGDSITDGTGSTPGAGRTWPDNLARRLARARPGELSVINMAIGGNRLLHPLTGPSGLARSDRDVFAIPGARFLLVLEGINDIAGWPEHPEEDVSAEDVIGALRQLVIRAHAHGLRAIGGTITPTHGCTDCGGSKGEASRQVVNAWIRKGGEFDAVVDFDRAVRDPMDPERLLAAFDCGDHLHLTDAGYAAMANAIDLSLFATDP